MFDLGVEFRGESVKEEVVPEILPGNHEKPRENLFELEAQLKTQTQYISPRLLCS